MTPEENWKAIIPVNKKALNSKKIGDLEKIAEKLRKAKQFADEASNINRNKVFPKWKNID